MFYDNTKTIYEVSAYHDAENPQEPCYMDKFRSKELAIREARSVKGRYARVEVISIEVDGNDPNNLLGENGVLAIWKYGKKIF